MLVYMVLWVVGGVALLAGFFFLLQFAMRARPEPGLGPRAGTTGVRASEGSWNGFLHRGTLGGTLGGQSGRFDVVDGQLHFSSDSSAESAWTLPCEEITVSTHFGILSHTVTLVARDQIFNCTASREHINLVSRNTAKSRREAEYAKEFAVVLQANGARRN